jgi:tRNA nucleotidyltransferase (CCA-adding enzyme)
MKMSKPTKLDLPIEKLKEIAQAINKNTLANRIRIKEDKITTDKFIRQFDINRKDFSETIKDTKIEYNKSTFLYDTESSANVIFSTTKVNLEQINKSSGKSNYTKPLKKQEPYQQTNQSNSKEVQSIPKNTFQLPTEFKELLSLTGDLKEMVGWYKKQINTNIIEVPELNINNIKLKGEIITRSFKMYKGIADEFSKFAEDRKEKQKDLISIAILEFINKYK